MFGEHEYNPSSPCFVRKENLILLQSVLAVSGAALSNSALLQTGKMNANQYATKKTIAQGMLDIALLTANASQLKYVLEVSPNQTKEVLSEPAGSYFMEQRFVICWAVLPRWGALPTTCTPPCSSSSSSACCCR